MRFSSNKKCRRNLIGMPDSSNIMTADDNNYDEVVGW